MQKFLFVHLRKICAAMTPSADVNQPKSWSELLQSYRSTFGSQSYATSAAISPQIRYTRSVPTVCPLSETKHPLYAVGAINVHTISKQCMACMAAFIDGSSHVVLKGECPQRPVLFSVVNGDKFMDIYRLQLIVCADSKQHQSSFAWMAKANAVMFATRHVGSAEVASNRTTQFSVHDSTDGSYQRSQFHGWGDVSLLKQDGVEGQSHPRGALAKPTGKKFVPAPCKEGRNGLFGLLQGTEAGGVDSWIGHPQIDPTKGKRAVSAPTDMKHAAGMGELLAQTAPGPPTSDAWLGNIQIDPAKGKGHAPDPASLRGRTDLFSIMQQQILTGAAEGQHPSSSSSCGGNSRAPADQDAWLGNRLLQPSKGKKAVDASPAAGAQLHAATFKGPPPVDGCWCDLPPIGKRPLSPPSNARHFVTAAQTMAIEEPLPQNAVVGTGKPHGKTQFSNPYSNSNPAKVDMYALMTFKPLTPEETNRCQQTWNDAPKQPRKKTVDGVAAAQWNSWQQLLTAMPAQPVRFVPRGGIAQERGMTLDAIIANRKHFQR